MDRRRSLPACVGFPFFNDASKCATYVPISIANDAGGILQIKPGSALPDQINRIALTRWENPPASAAEWEANQRHIPEPAALPGTMAAGVVIIESDGRIWSVVPTRGFAGMDNTFPKGQIDGDMSIQATARKEAYEESGLQIELKAYLHDYHGHGGVMRYYVARRIGGTPADVGWESQAVRLVPMAQLPAQLTRDNNRREREVLMVLQSNIRAFNRAY